MLFCDTTSCNDFELFKDNIKHKIKANQIAFLKDVLIEDTVTQYIENDKPLYALYTLAMLDYLSRINHFTICNKYDYLRTAKFQRTIYPLSIVTASMFENKDKDDIIQDYIKENKEYQPIPEFLRHNIIEGDVFNVC